MINKTINGYTIKHLIGSGGMADVYYAENSLGFPAAIKVLKKEYSHHDQVQERFVHEAIIMKSVDHNNIRKVLDMGSIDGQAAIIMEYLEGKSLKELIQSGKILSDEFLRKYFDQCVQALNYIHTKNIIHRDIKPSNLFITKEDEVKLVDFGISKSELKDNTMTGQTLGTVMYMSPEQVVDPKRVTGKTDVYSLGVTFYHALTGKPPYDTNTGSEFTVQQKIVYEDLDLSLIPANWKEILKGCLHKNPEDRFVVETINFDDGTEIDNFPKSISIKESEPVTNHSQQKRKWIFFVIGGLIFFLSLLLWFYLPLIKTKFVTRVIVDTENPTKPVNKDALYYAVSEYERKLNPKITNDQVITKAEWARQNPEQYFAETYNKLSGKNIDEETINRLHDLTGIKFDINKFPHFDANQQHEQFETKHIKSSAQKAAEEINNSMVRIPGGTFMMGCTNEHGNDCYENEHPVKEVIIKSFYISKYEVTQEQWMAIMGSNPSYFKGCNMCPVENVSYNDINSFISKLNKVSGQIYSLLSEEEWEYASRGGGDGTRYSGSDNIEDVAWFLTNSGSKTHPVGQKKANGYGLYDMSGNVWEWTKTNFGKTTKVIRGGSWSHNARDCRVSNRGSDVSANWSNNYFGFRLRSN